MVGKGEVGKGLWLERKVGGKGNILERGIRASWSNRDERRRRRRRRRRRSRAVPYEVEFF